MKGGLLSRDLMFSSQVGQAASAAGVELRTIGDVSSVEDESLVIVDLTMPGLDIATTIAALDSQGVRVLAIGPHVQGEKLTAAEHAGAWRVLTKGQAHRELATVLQEATESI